MSAVSNSALSMVEGLLLGSPFAIRREGGKTEALDLGNIIDRILWDKDYLSKIVLIEEGGIGYKAWKNNCDVEDLMKKVKVKFDDEADNKFSQLSFKFYDAGKWKRGRTKDEVQFCKEYSAYVSVQMEIMSHNVEKEKYKFLHGEYNSLVDRHNSEEIVLLNLLFDKPSDIHQVITKMVYSIENNKDYQKLLGNEKNTEIMYQHPLYWKHNLKREDEIQSVTCKGLPDVIIVNHKDKTISIVDLKTTQYSDNRMYKMKRYFRQVAFYIEGLNSIISKYDGKIDKYKVFGYILNVKYTIKKEEVKVYSELLMVSQNDLKTAHIGGIIKPDWQTDNVFNRISATWNIENQEFQTLGINQEDKRYRVYSIDELINEFLDLKNIDEKSSF